MGFQFRWWHHYLLVFAFGFLVTFLPVWDVPIDSNHWILLAYFVSAPVSFIESLYPLVLSYPTFLYLHRPLAVMMYGFLYNSVGLNGLAFHLVQSAIVGFFGCTVYRFLKNLGGGRMLPMLASLMTVASVPVLTSAWYIADTDMFGAAFVLLGVSAFIGLFGKRLSRDSAALFALFLFFSLMAIIGKEISRMFLLVYLFSYMLVMLVERRKVDRMQLAAILLVTAFALLFTSTMFGIDFPDWYKTPLTAGSLGFKILHNLTQMMYPIFMAGSLLLFTSAVHFRPARKWAALIGTALFVLMLSSPLLVEFSFFALVMYSDTTMVFFFSVLMAAGLAIKAARERGMKRFISLASLLMVSAIITTTAVFDFSRDDIAARIFILAAPLLFYLVLDSIRDLWNGFRSDRTLLGKVFLAVLLISSFMLAYQVSAGVADRALNVRAHYITEHHTRHYLAGLDLAGSAVLFNDVVNPFIREDMAVLGNDARDAGFVFVNTDKASGRPEDMERELCVDTSLSLPRPETTYVHLLIRRPRVDGALLPVLEGNFTWTEEDTTFRMLHPTELQASFWTSEYGMARTEQRSTYSERTLLEEFLDRKGELLFESASSYVQPSRWLEDTVSRALLGVPHFITYDYIGKVYRLDTSVLDCDNWYFTESYNGTDFRWAYQDARLVYSNPGNETRKVKLSFSTSSFHKPRTLDVLLNGEKVASYSVTNTWLDNEIMTPFLDMKPGDNTVILHSREGCDIPYVTGDWDYDLRCISFAFVNMTFLETEDLAGRLLFSNGWYAQNSDDWISIRWMGNESEMELYSDSLEPERARLGLVIWPFHRPRTLSLAVNGEPLAHYGMESAWASYYFMTPYFDILPGENTIALSAGEGCEVPSEVGEWEVDKRCLTFGVSHLDIFREENVSGRLLHETGWFGTEVYNGTPITWMGDEATLAYHNPGDSREDIKIKMGVSSFDSPRTLQVSVNGKDAVSYEISNAWVSEVTTPFLSMEPGDNVITLASREGCGMMGEGDRARCLGLVFTLLAKMGKGYLEGRGILSQGWHPPAERLNITHIALSEEGTMAFYRPGEAPSRISITLIAASFKEPRRLSVSLGGRELFSDSLSNREFRAINIEAGVEEGENTITFSSLDGCGTDSLGRCASFLVSDVFINYVDENEAG